jgi:hypothetical protein
LKPFSSLFLSREVSSKIPQQETANVSELAVNVRRGVTAVRSRR